MTLPADIGPYTSAAACRLKPGYYLRSWQPVVCNQGSWNAGLNRVATCTPCAANVTTAGPGATSAADCRYLVKGYEAVTVAVSGEITAVRPCRQNAYCPGDVTAPGWTACPRGMWTKSGGRTAQNECFTPPGYFLPADGTSNITKCTTGVNGAYKSGWGSDAACTVCGPGIYSDAATNVTVYDPATDTSTPDYVASDVSACFVYPGMGMAHQLRRVGNGYQFVGAKCNRVEGINQHSTFGYTTYTRGLTVRPCRRCAGVPTGSGPIGGATGCAIPAGYAAVGYNGSVFFSTGFVWARVKNVTLCPTGFYCVGGDPTTDAAAQPAACGTGTTTAVAGASDASQCNACIDSNAEYTGGSCRCKAGYTAVNSVCTACPEGSYAAAGALQCTQCNAGQFAAQASASCSSCLGNTYSGSGAALCSSCPANANAITGNTACQCSYGYEAAPGTSFVLGNLTCQACTGSTYTANGVTECTACPAHTTVLSNHTGCVCDAGCSGAWPGACTNCPVRCPTNAEPSEGGTSCQCSYGFEAVPGTSFASGNLTCQACTGSTYTANGVSTCTACPANAVAISGNTACQCSYGYEAAPGTSFASGNLTCQACTGDTYTANGVSTCTSCPANAVAISGNTACQCSYGYEAAPGTSFASGNLTCQACTGSTYTASGVTTCTACPADSSVLGSHTGCVCNSGCSGAWPAACSSCDYAPAAPTLLSVDAPSNSSLNVTWQTNQAGLFGPKVTTRYQVKCYTTASNPMCSTEGVLLDLVDAAASATQSSTVTGLQPSTQYTCFVTAFNSQGLSSGTCSSWITASTLAS